MKFIQIGQFKIFIQQMFKGKLLEWELFLLIFFGQNTLLNPNLQKI
jgi:hypothetical protein